MNPNPSLVENLTKQLSELPNGKTAVVRGVLLTKSKDGTRFTFRGASYGLTEAVTRLCQEKK